MTGEIYSYTPLHPQGESMTLENLAHLPSFPLPNIKNVYELYCETGFPDTIPGGITSTAVLRGSTAALLPDDGEIVFRHPRSDIDILAITNYATFLGAAYFICWVSSPDFSDQKRETHIIYATPERLRKDFKNRYHTFLQTKLAPPGVPILNQSELERWRVEALASLILTASSRRGIHYMTVSGAARLILEEQLFAEPQRWISLRTYYLLSPQGNRNRLELIYYTNRALLSLVTNYHATQLRNSSPTDPAFDVNQLNPPKYLASNLERFPTLLAYVYDQLSILAFSRQKITLGRIRAVLMKLQSILMNPKLSYNVDELIFNRKA